MQKFYALLCFLFIGVSSLAQEIDITAPDSYEKFVTSLNESKDLRYQEILARYDAFIEAHPDNVIVRLNRCQFIGNAYYDDYEDYDTNWEQTAACIDSLYKAYPYDPGVILYKMENVAWDEQLEFFEESLSKYVGEKSVWTDAQVSELYQQGAYQLTEEDDFRAITFAEIAEEHDDSLDLSVLIANAQIRLGNEDEAREVLLASLDKKSEVWKMNQKAELLVNMEEYDTAFELYEQVREMDSSYVNEDGLYKIAQVSGDMERARQIRLDDTVYEWNKANSFQKLLDHDLEYGTAEEALQTYRRMQEIDYYDDFFGVKRFKIFLKDPFLKWSGTELSHIAIFIAFLIVLFFIPYLWVIPVYGLGQYLKKNGRSFKKVFTVDWGLKHFWLISFLYLLSQVLIILIFYYEEYMNDIFSVAYTYLGDEVAESSSSMANSLMGYSLIMAVLVLFVLNRKRIQFTFRSNIDIVQTIGLSIAFVVFNLIVLSVLGGIIDLDETAGILEPLSIREDVMALIEEKGLLVSILVVAVLVPIYEEIMFRGVILVAVHKHIGFIGANIIQSLLFATVHFNLKLFIFYFIFGMITGIVAKRTGGLRNGILFHAANNFFVLILLYFAMQTGIV